MRGMSTRCHLAASYKLPGPHKNYVVGPYVTIMLIIVNIVPTTETDTLETEYFTDNYVDNVRSPVIDIANLSTILDNDLTYLLDVPVCSDLNYEPFKYIENNNYFMCEATLPSA